MVYNPENQYRCTIIRGKAKTEIDDLLPAYANIISEICPCNYDDFRRQFDSKISNYLSSPTQKTLDNHRTEIAGSLFGMWYRDVDGNVYPTERTMQLLETGDNPQFFKQLVNRFQFPSGMDKVQTVRKRMKQSINIRPCAYILKLLQNADKSQIRITRDEIGYYVLNNLDVLQGNVSVDEVLAVIVDRQKNNDYRNVRYPGKGYSYSLQHINELLNIMELANLIRTNKKGKFKELLLNNKETAAIEFISKSWDKTPNFDVYGYDIGAKNSFKKLSYAWQAYLGSIGVEGEEIFVTTIENLVADVDQGVVVEGRIVEGLRSSNLGIGEEGEQIVFKYEKERVKQFNERLVNKVIFFGKQRGLGYDVSSIRADRSSISEHAIYIEVKSTKRVTSPTEEFKDQFELTRNEWIAAEQHLRAFFIYRVYITNEGVRIFTINNPKQLREDGIIYAEPTKYTLEFTHRAGSFLN